MQYGEHSIPIRYYMYIYIYIYSGSNDVILYKMTHLYVLPVAEPTSKRAKSANDPEFDKYVLLLNGLNSIADINGTPKPVFTRQICK